MAELSPSDGTKLSFSITQQTPSLSARYREFRLESNYLLCLQKWNHPDPDRIRLDLRTDWGGHHHTQHSHIRYHICSICIRRLIPRNMCVVLSCMVFVDQLTKQFGSWKGIQRILVSTLWLCPRMDTVNSHQFLAYFFHRNINFWWLKKWSQTFEIFGVSQLTQNFPHTKSMSGRLTIPVYVEFPGRLTSLCWLAS
jgi:hypothetical protein